MTSNDIIYVDSSHVSCDGHNDVSGHPMIYLEIDETMKAICPYCSKEFHLTKAE